MSNLQIHMLRIQYDLFLSLCLPSGFYCLFLIVLQFSFQMLVHVCHIMGIGLEGILVNLTFSIAVH